MTVEKKISAKVITPAALSQQEQTAQETSQNSLQLPVTRWDWFSFCFSFVGINWNAIFKQFTWRSNRNRVIRAVLKWLSKVITWLRLLRLGAPVSQPMRSKTKTKTKTNRTMYAWFFPHFERVAGDCQELWLVHRAVRSCCDWSE